MGGNLKKMKICIINFVHSKYAGGAAVSVRILAESLKKRGHEVFIITTGSYKALKSLNPSLQIEDGIKVYRFYPVNLTIPFYTGRKTSLFEKICTFLLNFWNPHTYFATKKILKKEMPDVININEVLYLSLSVYSAARSLNVPIVSTIRSVILLFPLNNLPYLDKIAGVHYPFGSYRLYEIISNMHAKINKIIIGNPDYVTFVSKAVKDIYSDHGFFKHSKKVVIKNIFEIDESESKQEKTEKKTFDILYAGGLNRIKGGHTLIKSFRRIKNSSIRLHIFGGGMDEKYFKDLAKGDKRIIFYGQVHNEEFQKFYKMADVSVMPSEYFETFGRIIIESFRVGVPVIGSNIGGIPEIIQEGHTGFLFGPGSVEELKNILEDVINNKEKLKEMGKNCINSAKKYSVENNIYKFEEVYKEAINSKITTK